MGERTGLASYIAAHNDDTSENIVQDISQLVGWTPLIEIKSITKADNVDARIIAKLESYQPSNSVKDRSALRMIENAEEKGLIKPGVTTLLEPTSGNLGIALAYIGLKKGYKFVGVMPSHYSIERRMLLKYLGADIAITDTKLGFKGVLDKVAELSASDPNMYVLNQFSNSGNPEAHYTTTGPEIWKDTGGKVDIFVVGSGSGGTVSGAGKYLKEKNPAVKVVCVEPAESPVIAGGQPGPHGIQGFGPGFVPDTIDYSVIDEFVTVTTQEAMAYARRIAKEEGMLMGISSGANLVACLKVGARPENKGKMIVTTFSSGGERYMSTQLFDEVREECVNMLF